MSGHTHRFREDCECWRCLKIRRRRPAGPVADFARELAQQPAAAEAPFSLTSPANLAIDAAQLRLLVEPTSDAGELRALINRYQARVRR
jgi:hypothetical protein